MANTITTSHTSRGLRSFRHEPLDQTQPSIRLIDINPGLSTEGLIECHVSHTTIEATYSCLSYRWGDDNPSSSRTILMNGEVFIVRQNLFDFLHCVCTSPSASENTSGKYWIDALCIDQSNLSERNHQVAQMGKIFAGAERVHIWLGSATPEDSWCIQTFFDGPNETMTLGSWIKTIRHDLPILQRKIFRNEYWTRAWVTQEILLAQSVLVQLSTQRVAWATMLERSRYCSSDWIDTAYRRFATQRDDGIHTDSSRLVSLLSHFGDRECSVLHDRVYSLLALCDKRDIVPVSYSTTVETLACEVLRRGNNLCICTAAAVAKELRLGEVHRRSGLRLTIEIEGLLVHWNDGLNWTWQKQAFGRPTQGRYQQGSCLSYWMTLLCANLEEYMNSSTLVSDRGVGHYQGSNEVCGDEFWTVTDETRARLLGESLGKDSQRLCDMLKGLFNRENARWGLPLAPGWHASVKDKRQNICIIEVDLWAIWLSHLSGSLCSEDTRWHWARHKDGPFSKIHLDRGDKGPVANLEPVDVSISQQHQQQHQQRQKQGYRVCVS